MEQEPGSYRRADKKAREEEIIAAASIQPASTNGDGDVVYPEVRTTPSILGTASYSQGTGPAIHVELFDFVEECIKTPYGDAEQEALLARAKANKYYYEFEDVFLAAMELYNREGCILRKRSLPLVGEFTEWRVLRKWERKEISGHHKKPCVHCQQTFDVYDDSEDLYYFVDTWNGPYHADKLCTGCMGRTLCFKYGANKTKIMDQLRTLRAKQKEKDGLPKQLSYFLPYYEEKYFGRSAREDMYYNLSRGQKTSEEVRALVDAEIAAETKESKETWWKCT